MQHMQGGALPVNTTDLEIMPLPKAPAIWEKLDELSIKATEQQGDLRELRRQMDSLIFELFRLSPEDIEVIETKYSEYMARRNGD